MKSAFVLFLFPLFAIGVFGDTVSVMEGDSVTLHTGVKLQRDEEIEWRFNNTRIARVIRNNVLYDDDVKFKNRLQLDIQTGDLKITNFRIRDTGLYKYEISSTSVSSEKTFSISVVPADEEKSVTVEVTVLDGDSVTLNTSLTDIQRDHVIRWRFGQQKSPLAEINLKAGIFSTYDVPDERFRDRLQLDNQTGSLTITNITATHSGLYEADISSSSSRYTTHHTQSFNVTVSDAVESPSVKEGKTVTLQIVTEVQKDDLIHWMFEDTVIAEIRKAAPQFYTSDGPDGRFRLRLYLDNQTGSLNIIKTRTTDSGDYQLNISGSRRTINRRITVTVTGSGLSSGEIAGIVVGVLVVAAAAAAAAGVIYCHHEISGQKSERGVNLEQNGGNHEKQDTDDPANEETKLANDP